MSDSIVLWRMCVVWGRTRPICAFAAILLLTTLGFNMADIVLITRKFVTYDASTSSNGSTAITGSGIITAYGRSDAGLAAAFLSLMLASNICATLLVGIKTWYVVDTSVLACRSGIEIVHPGCIEGSSRCISDVVTVALRFSV